MIFGSFRFPESLNLVVACLFLLGHIVADAQSATKFEREYRMDISEVPDQASAFIDSCELEGRIRWYRQEGLTDNTYEAKVRHEGHLYSIEFDSLGQLLDVEVKVNEGEVPESTKSGIEQTLNQVFSRWRI